jgi:hypothetical protein
MSQENVDVVRMIYSVFEASQGEAGFEAIIGALEIGPWTPDMEWDSREVEAFGVSDIVGIYQGAEGGKRFWGTWLPAWETIEVNYEIRDAGDSVVVLLDQRMRGRSTGIEVDFGKHAQVWEFRDGLVSRWKFHASQQEALQAVGLSE